MTDIVHGATDINNKMPRTAGDDRGEISLIEATPAAQTSKKGTNPPTDCLGTKKYFEMSVAAIGHKIETNHKSKRILKKECPFFFSTNK